MYFSMHSTHHSTVQNRTAHSMVFNEYIRGYYTIHTYTRTTECRERKTLSKGIKIKNLALKVKKKKKEEKNKKNINNDKKSNTNSNK